MGVAGGRSLCKRSSSSAEGVGTAPDLIQEAKGEESFKKQSRQIMYTVDRTLYNMAGFQGTSVH